MNIKYLAKFKPQYEDTCCVCVHYLECHRIRAGDCFSIHPQIIVDMKLFFPEYFSDRRNSALKLLEDK